MYLATRFNPHRDIKSLRSVSREISELVASTSDLSLHASLVDSTQMTLKARCSRLKCMAIEHWGRYEKPSFLGCC